MPVQNKKAINDDFNISTPVSTTVMELAQVIWKKINGDKPFKYVCDKPFKYDVQKRVPSTEKAKKVLNIECKTTLEQALEEVVPWISHQIETGGF